MPPTNNSQHHGLSRLLHTNPDNSASGYPAPDRDKINARVIAWQDTCYLADTADQIENQLADDFMYGFDTQNDFERRILGLCAARGLGPRDEVRQLTNLSLLRGFDEWNQVMACAESHRRMASPAHPLDGHDLLTYLAPLVHPQLALGIPFAFNLKAPHKPKRQQKRGTKKRSHQASTDDGQLPALRPASKKAKTQNSHYWADDTVATQPQCTSMATPRGDTVQTKPSTPPDLVEPLMDRPLEKQLNISTPLWYHIGGHLKAMHSQIISRLSPARKAPGKTRLATPAARPLSPSPDPKRTTEKPQQQQPPQQTAAPIVTPKKRTITSHFFLPPTPSSLNSKKQRPPRGTVSCLPFPPLDAPRFGLIQEEVAAEPFQLLIAVTLLIRTKGRDAIPVFRSLMARYATPWALAAADRDDVVKMIRHLGLGEVRADMIQKHARLWSEKPPAPGIVFAVRGYPDYPDKQRGLELPGVQDAEEDEFTESIAVADGGEGDDILDDSPPQDSHEDEEESPHGEEGEGENDGENNVMEAAAVPRRPPPPRWEIGHMTQGCYALDSWRIFCRDALLGRGPAPPAAPGATNNNDHRSENDDAPEWKRVRPRDKELRAYLRWMWMRDGWEWDPVTGRRVRLRDGLRAAVMEGRVEWDNQGGLSVVEADTGTVEQEG